MRMKTLFVATVAMFCVTAMYAQSSYPAGYYAGECEPNVKNYVVSVYIYTQKKVGRCAELNKRVSNGYIEYAEDMCDPLTTCNLVYVGPQSDGHEFEVEMKNGKAIKKGKILITLKKGGAGNGKRIAIKGVDAYGKSLPINGMLIDGFNMKGVN